MKTVKHYKTLENLFFRNMNEKLISPKYGHIQMSGSTWYHSGYYSDTDRKKPATLYLATDNRWMIIQ